MKRFVPAALLLGALSVLCPAARAAARQLHWSDFEVEARLDADGRLHVVERQTMVFSGDWNGGERTFRRFPGQRLELHAVRRIDPERGAVELERGDLDRVDRWDWHSRDTLRWRSRRPDDPPFDGTALVYELDYTLSGVLLFDGDRYRLDHDFAFPDRAGVIEHFELDLELDDAWEPVGRASFAQPGPEGHRIRVERRELAPGRGVVLTVGLRHVGPGEPAAVRRRLPDSVRNGLVAAVTLVVGLLIWRFFAFERRQGRFDEPDMPEPPSRAWLEENLLGLRPEEAGALWDQDVGAAEVAAVLARLVSEGKLESRVREVGRWFKRPVLELDLLVDRDELGSYERKLIAKLFFGGRERTDTEAVRKHYETTGFSPAEEIRDGLESRVYEQPGFRRRIAAPSRWPTALLLLAAAACLGIELWRSGGAGMAGPAFALAAVAMAVPLLLGYIFCFLYRHRSLGLGGLAAGFLLPMTAGTAAVLAILRNPGLLPPGLEEIGIFGVVAIALLPIALLNSVLNNARTRDSRRAVEVRRRLAAIRRHFARQLRRPEPRLEDDWLPYLLAFGLDGQVDRWLRAHGRRASDVARRVTGSVHTSSGGSSGGGWTGGGGAFGGAGATAAWSAAAGTLAAGVAKPGSGGSGGGGGGGGSSGGGGGGGW